MSYLAVLFFILTFDGAISGSLGVSQSVVQWWFFVNNFQLPQGSMPELLKIGFAFVRNLDPARMKDRLSEPRQRHTSTILAIVHTYITQT